MKDCKIKSFYQVNHSIVKNIERNKFFDEDSGKGDCGFLKEI